MRRSEKVPEVNDKTQPDFTDDWAQITVMPAHEFVINLEWNWLSGRMDKNMAAEMRILFQIPVWLALIVF